MERLTLEDTISRAKEVAEKNYRGADFESIDSVDNDIKTNCIKCAKEHMQLAEWLEELKSYKELEEHLHKIFGEESTFSLADVVNALEMKLSKPDKKHPVNARILTYEDADKWKEYKELEEQGLLLKLPVNKNNEIYIISSRWTVCSECGSRFDEYSCSGCEYECDSKKEYYVYPTYLSSITVSTYVDRFGKTVFLTREEAEKKLEEMKAND